MSVPSIRADTAQTEAGLRITTFYLLDSAMKAVTNSSFRIKTH
jgi:hypothetical protein